MGEGRREKMDAAIRQEISFFHEGESVSDVKLTLRAIPYIYPRCV
jgi:hypothetical protein